MLVPNSISKRRDRGSSVVYGWFLVVGYAGKIRTRRVPGVNARVHEGLVLMVAHPHRRVDTCGTESPKPMARWPSNVFSRRLRCADENLADVEVTNEKNT